MKVRKISIFSQMFLGLAVLLLIGDGILGYLTYSQSKASLFTQIQGNAKNIAQCAAANVSADVFQMIDNGDEETDYYATIVDELALFRDHAELEYIYTVREKAAEEYVLAMD